MTTLREPRTAAWSIVSVAVAEVGLVTLTDPKAPSAAPPTEMALPKLATVLFAVKLVEVPVMVTVTVEFGAPTFGLITVIVGKPDVTVRALTRVAASPLVVTVTARAPGV